MATLSVGTYVSNDGGMNHTLLALKLNVTENKSMDDMRMRLV